MRWREGMGEEKMEGKGRWMEGERKMKDKGKGDMERQGEIEGREYKWKGESEGKGRWRVKGEGDSQSYHTLGTKILGYVFDTGLGGIFSFVTNTGIINTPVQWSCKIM